MTEKRPKNHTFLREQKGMGLLEVVVSMLIIGLGMAMSVAMIQVSVKNSISAHNQNAARTLAESIRDRMRINRFAASAYQFGDNDNSASNNNDSIDLFNTNRNWQAPTIATLESANSLPSCAKCTQTQIATRQNAFQMGYSDTVNWLANVQAALPGSRAAILPLPNNQYRVLVQWQNITPDARTLEDNDPTNDIDPSAPPIQESSLVFAL